MSRDELVASGAMYVCMWTRRKWHRIADNKSGVLCNSMILHGDIELSSELPPDAMRCKTCLRLP